MAKKTLSILMLEDVETDASLVQYELRKEDIPFAARRVETREDFAKALEESAPDLILADYRLPAFDGLAALKMTQERRPGTPFIFVSGAIGEETAIEAVKLGATDYVLKDRLQRLGPSVRRALAEAEERTRLKRAEQELRRVNRALRVLGECDHALARANEEPRLLREVCRIVVEVGGYRLAWVGYPEMGKDKIITPLAQAGADEGYLNEISVSWADSTAGSGPTGKAIRLGKVQIGRNYLTDPELATWREAAARHGFASVIALPLVFKRTTYGVLTIYAPEPDAFDGQEVELLAHLAEDLAFGIASLRIRAEREQAVAALQESERKYRTLFDASPIGIGIADAEGRFYAANRILLEMLGFSWDEFSRTEARQLYADPRNRDALIRRVQADASVRDWEGRLKRNDGAVFHALINMDLVELGGQQLVLATVRDISEQKRLEKEVLEISQVERQRVGRDLHDVVGQTLTGISFLTRALQQRLADAAVPHADAAGQIAELASQAVAQTRALARGLAPVELKAEGLISALTELVVHVREVFGVQCEYHCDKPVLIHNDAIATQLYYIALEAANNAAKHANPSRMTIDLRDQGERIVLTVTDDGTGIGPDAGQGLGLRTMNYRARMIGASLAIRSGAGGGTIVECSLPRQVLS